MLIKTVNDLREALKPHTYCYGTFFVTNEGEVLSVKAVKNNIKDVIRAIKFPDNNSTWKLTYCDINWENQELYCEETNERIEPIYSVEESIIEDIKCPLIQQER